MERSTCCAGAVVCLLAAGLLHAHWQASVHACSAL
jgi:hypothetical protein